MLLAFFIIFLILVINVIFYKSNFEPFRLIAGLSWLLPIILIANPSTIGLTAGSSIQVALLVILVGVFLISLFGAFRGNMQVTTSNSKNGNSRSVSAENGNWHLPSFMKSSDSPEAIRARRVNKLTSYRERAHDAIYGARRRDRNGRYLD